MFKKLQELALCQTDNGSKTKNIAKYSSPSVRGLKKSVRGKINILAIKLIIVLIRIINMFRASSSVKENMLTRIQRNMFRLQKWLEI